MVGERTAMHDASMRMAMRDACAHAHTWGGGVLESACSSLDGGMLACILFGVSGLLSLLLLLCTCGKGARGEEPREYGTTWESP